MGHIAYQYDKLNDFGTLSTAGDFPNTINMGEATAARMSVDLKLPDRTVTGGPVTLTVKGSYSEEGAYSAIVSSGSITEEMLNDGYALPMPKTGYQYLKVEISGDFNGRVQALINSFPGM